jgi:hypothetical protein
MRAAWYPEQNGSNPLVVKFTINFLTTFDRSLPSRQSGIFRYLIQTRQLPVPIPEVGSWIILSHPLLSFHHFICMSVTNLLIGAGCGSGAAAAEDGRPS